MLREAGIVAIVPVSDVEAGLSFYAETLGLELLERREDLPENREAELTAAHGRLLLYESVGAGKSRHTVAGFRVADLDAVVVGLRERGVESRSTTSRSSRPRAASPPSATFAPPGAATRTATSSPWSPSPGAEPAAQHSGARSFRHGPGRIRTCDLGIKSPLLCQLSYRPAKNECSRGRTLSFPGRPHRLAAQVTALSRP